MTNNSQILSDPPMEKSKEIHINSIDIAKMIAFVQVVINAINWNKKFRILVEHNPEEKKSTIQIYK